MKHTEVPDQLAPIGLATPCAQTNPIGATSLT